VAFAVIVTSAAPRAVTAKSSTAGPVALATNSGAVGKIRRKKHSDRPLLGSVPHIGDNRGGIPQLRQRQQKHGEKKQENQQPRQIHMNIDTKTETSAMAAEIVRYRELA
jgi:hypothetical protein